MQMGVWTHGVLVEELVEAIVPAIEVDGTDAEGQRIFVSTRAQNEPLGSLGPDADGRSLVLFANGDKYIGGIQAGKKHGDGMYVYADGSAYKGSWSEDSLAGDVHPDISKDAQLPERAE